MLKYLVLMFNISIAVQLVLAMEQQEQTQSPEIIFIRLIAVLIFANLGVIFVKVVYPSVHFYDFVAVLNNVTLLILSAGGYFYYGFNSNIFSLDGAVTALPSLYYFYKENRKKTESCNSEVSS